LDWLQRYIVDRWAIGPRVLAILLLGALLLAVVGCMGGSRNFSAAGESKANASPAPAASTSAAPRVGNEAPDFALEDLNGQTVRLSDLRGKPILINFWATWCPPCKEEMPDLEKAYRKYRRPGCGLSWGVDEGEKADTVRRFVQQSSYSWTFLLDTEMKVTSLVQSYIYSHELLRRPPGGYPGRPPGPPERLYPRRETGEDPLVPARRAGDLFLAARALRDLV